MHTALNNWDCKVNVRRIVKDRSSLPASQPARFSQLAAHQQISQQHGAHKLLLVTAFYDINADVKGRQLFDTNREIVWMYEIKRHQQEDVSFRRAVARLCFLRSAFQVVQQNTVQYISCCKDPPVVFPSPSYPFAILSVDHIISSTFLSSSLRSPSPFFSVDSVVFHANISQRKEGENITNIKR